MSDQSAIQWTDATWNPVVGCTPVSPGCLNCYAAVMAHRLEKMGQERYTGLTVSRGGFKVVEAGENHGGPAGSTAVTDHPKRRVFNGTVRTVPEALQIPLRWKKPRRIFVNSMSDLFHEDVPFEFVDRVFAVMALCPRHTFQVLTKRPERMEEYLQDFYPEGGRLDRMMDCAGLEGDPWHGRMEEESDLWLRLAAIDVLPNVWLGTSVERQKEADQRIMHLIKCPAAVRFLSVEPLLGPIDLTSVGGFTDGKTTWRENVLRWQTSELAQKAGIDRINSVDWVIVGGESGANARPMNMAWMRGIVEQCRRAGVPVFVKQMGARPWVNFYTKHPELEEWSRERERCVWEPDGLGRVGGVEAIGRWHPRDGQPRSGAVIEVALQDRKGGDWAEWPDDLRVRQFPECASKEAT